MSPAKGIYWTGFVASCALVAHGVYDINSRGIGFGSQPRLAIITAAMSVGLFVVMTLVVTENLSERGKAVFTSALALLLGAVVTGYV